MATEAERKEVMEALTLAASIGEGVYGAVEDGDITIGDYRHFIPAVGDILPALGNINVALEAIKNRTPEDMAVYNQHFKDEFNIPDDLGERFIENCVGTLEHLIGLVDTYREWRSRPELGTEPT